MPSLLSSTIVILVVYVSFKKSKKLRYIVRTLFYFIALSLCSLSGMVLAPPLFLLGFGTFSNYFVGKVGKVLFPLLTGIQTKVVGQQYLTQTRPCVFVANHQTRLDMMSLGATIGPYTVIMAKESIKFYPFIGQYMMMAKNVFINRTNRTSAVETMKTVAEKLIKDKTAIYMYPEGTRSHQSDHSMLPFKKGAFHLAIQGQMPIIPVVVSTYAPIYSEKEMKFEPGTVTIQGNFFFLFEF